MDPFHLCLALGPISVYLLVLGHINLSRRPFLTSGARDILALGISTAGFAAAGPLALFMPEGVAVLLGPWIWVPLLGLYFLCLLLLSMLMRPRLVVYNMSAEKLHPVLDQVALQLDPDRRWAGGSLVLPNRGLQLVVETFPAMKNVQLIAAGTRNQELGTWRRLEIGLKEALKSVEVARNPRGYSFLFFGVLMAAMILLELNRQPHAVAQSIDEFLHR